MFDDLFGDLGTSLTDFFESQIFQIGVRVLVIYIVLIWLASAYWAYRDMRLRSASAITPYVAAATIIVFTPIFFLFGLLIYRIVRPKETIAEVNERALAEEAMMAEVASHSQCANCSRPVHEDWIICPTCRNRLRRVCPNCEHLIELDWTLCAWCGKDFERAETAGTAAAFMPSARPQPRLQGGAPRPPAPPPPAPTRRPQPSSNPPGAEAPKGQPSSGAAPAGTPGPSAQPSPSTQPPGAQQPPGPTPRSSQASSSSASGGGAPSPGAQGSSPQPPTGI
jgi:RNA polymerase subunit RPABC4/transcription elongation factor Spt4